ncbi:MAG: hypothetical protein H0U67_16790 [Gemmatimonadetes bacterium]|nr:hypothetical protein [Gemmatimonadota bacterium]
MPMELPDILGAIAEYVGDDKDKAREVALAIHKKDETQPVAQVLVNRGMTKRTADAAAKVATLEAQISGLKSEVEEKDGEIQQLRTEQPNWGKRVEETEKRYQQRLNEAQQHLEAEKKARREDQLAIHRQRFVSKLGPGTQVDKEWAETVLASKYADRLRLDDEGHLEVLEVGESTPYDAAGGDPIDLLVQDVLRTVPGKYRILGTPSPGGGTQGGGSAEVKPKSKEELAAARKREGTYAF